ncbi:MAG: hypothetical protein WBQ49_12510 [Rhodomicrobium sp.]
MCTASTVDGIALSELSEKDFQPVSCLLSRSFGGKPEWYTAYFKYWWKHNPAWNETIPRGWVAKSDNGDAVAFTSNIPFEYRINGASALCCATGSTAVDARWRGQGLSKRVASRFLQQPNPALLVGTGSTEVAYRMWLSLGMKPLQRSWPSSSYCILGSVTGYAQTKLNNKVPALAFRITGAVETAIYGTLISLARAGSRLDIQKVDCFDASDDEDLLACRASAASIYPLRNAKILNWLYFHPHIRDARAVHVAKSGGRILGFIALKHYGHLLLLLECRTRDLDIEVARQLFLAAQDYASRNGVSYIRIWRYTPMIDAAAPRLGRITSPAPMTTYCYKANVSLREEDWESTPGDGDLSVN